MMATSSATTPWRIGDAGKKAKDQCCGKVNFRRVTFVCGFASAACVTADILP
jgi:hypothetical protein